MRDLTRDDLARMKALVDDAKKWKAALAKSPQHYGHWCSLEIAKDRIADAILDSEDALLAAAERDLDRREGLVFGPPTNFGVRFAETTVRASYSLRQLRDGVWRWTDPEGESGHARTEAEAIDAARAHDAARRGGK